MEEKDEEKSVEEGGNSKEQATLLTTGLTHALVLAAVTSQADRQHTWLVVSLVLSSETVDVSGSIQALLKDLSVF